MTSQRLGEDVALWGLLTLVLVINLLAMPALRYDGDANAWEMEAESLVQRGRLEVTPSIAELIGRGAPYFIFNRETGRYHSKYGIGNTLVYTIPLLFERFVLGVSEPSRPEGIFGRPGGAVYRIDRRIQLLNGFNILLSLLLAWVLYRLASLYPSAPQSRLLFVLACFYSTYLWNYLRAHSSQIYQCLFFSVALLFLIRYRRKVIHEKDPLGFAEGRDLLWSALALSALCLVKTAFLPLVGIWAVTVLLILQRGAEQSFGQIWKSLRDNLGLLLGYAAFPIVLLVTILLVVNDIKFGSPFRFGYARDTNLFGAPLSESVPGYLFHPRYSIFIHFPVLVVALFGLPKFWRRHRFELVVSWAFFLVMFAVNSNYIFWKGEAAVGPRYLLFALPALSLPFVSVLESLSYQRARLRRGLLTAAVALLLGFSTMMQTKLNALEFHVFFRFRDVFLRSEFADPELFAYFRTRNTALLHAEFLAFRDRGEPPFPLRKARESLDPERYADLEALVREHLESNYYFR